MEYQECNNCQTRHNNKIHYRTETIFCRKTKLDQRENHLIGKKRNERNLTCIAFLLKTSNELKTIELINIHDDLIRFIGSPSPERRATEHSLRYRENEDNALQGFNVR